MRKGKISKKIMALIPARGASRGLPRKNALKILGKPLVSYSIVQSIQSKYIEKTVVSSEDEEILEIAEKENAEIIRRPSHLSRDEAFGNGEVGRLGAEVARCQVEGGKVSPSLNPLHGADADNRDDEESSRT